MGCSVQRLRVTCGHGRFHIGQQAGLVLAVHDHQLGQQILIVAQVGQHLLPVEYRAAWRGGFGDWRRGRVIVAGMVDQDLDQVRGMYGLGQVAVHAGLQAALPVALHGVGGHGDDRGMGHACRFPFADHGGGLEAAHHRHLHVHQDDVEAACRVERQRLLTVVGHLHVVAQLGQ